MKVVKDILSYKESIESSIKKYGFFAEHNFWHYYYKQYDARKGVYFSFNEEMGLMAHRTRNKVWHLFTEILAPKKKRTELFKRFLEQAYREGASKVTVEVTEPFRKNILALVSKSKIYYVPKYNWILYWPLYNMKTWDHTLSGKSWKKIRNAINSLYKKHEINILPASEFQKKQLRKIINMWVASRNDSDKVDTQYYHNVVENNFKGFDMTRVIAVDNEPCAITAGWEIPNSNNYYSSLGLLDYSIPGLGELANIDDLRTLKERGYSYVDFGGSYDKLLEFKKKYKPESFYKTYVFSVLRK